MSANPGTVRTGNVRSSPGKFVSIQPRWPRRRFCPCGKMTRAGALPNKTSRNGFTRAINRYRNGRQMAISAGEGGRPPGGRQGSNGVNINAVRVKPMLSNI